MNNKERIEIRDEADRVSHERAKELLPCPFCGSNILEIVNTHTASYWVECECGATCHGLSYAPDGDPSMKMFCMAINTAIKRWNKRVGLMEVK